MDLSSLGDIIGIAVVAILALPLIIAGVFVILVVANRADPDPSGRRPVAVYASAVAFIALFATLFGTYGAVAKLFSLIGSHPHPAVVPDSSDSLDLNGLTPTGPTPVGPAHPIGDAAVRGIVLGLLVALVAGLVYLVHARAARAAAHGEPRQSPSARVRSSYLSAVCFISVAIAVIATVAGIYDLFRVFAPGVFSSTGIGNRTTALRQMLPLLYLAAASYGLLFAHLRRLPPDARPTWSQLRFGPAGPGTVEPEPHLPSAPLAAPAEVIEVAPPPRKRAPRRPRPPVE